MIEYTVSQIVYKLKDIVENDNALINCQVKGEITNFTGRYPSGHMYFSIKDEDSTIACVMFASYASKLNFDLQNGDKVILKATPSIYNKTGKLQLNVTALKKDGVGDLLQKYEELKKKLTEQGYFDDNHKKILDIEYPNNVAVIVGDNSAAMSDIKRTFARRWPLCNVDYYPSMVQGDKAPDDLIKNLKLVDSKNYEIVIIARGGGSFEDLFCFNDENLIKTIYNMKTYTVSGVGHEQDFTLCDFVCDKRASTPTASVELITPDIEEIIDRLDMISDDIKTIIENKFDILYQTIDNSILKLNYFSKKIENMSKEIKMFKTQIASTLKNKYELRKQDLLSKINILNAYSQENTLKRGYSIVYKNNKIINTSKELNKNDEIEIRLYKSKVKAEIKEV